MTGYIAVGHADDFALPLAEGHQVVRLFAAEAQRLASHTTCSPASSAARQMA